MGYRPPGRLPAELWWQWPDPYDRAARAARQSALWRGVLARLRDARPPELGDVDAQARIVTAQAERIAREAALRDEADRRYGHHDHDQDDGEAADE